MVTGQPHGRREFDGQDTSYAVTVDPATGKVSVLVRRARMPSWKR